MRTRNDNIATSNLLANQRLKRKRRHRLPIKKILIISSLIGILLAASLFAYINLQNFLLAKFSGYSKPWQIEVSIDPPLKQSSDLSKNIERYWQEERQEHASVAFERLADKIKQNLPVENLQIIQTSAQNIYVKLKLFVPFMKIEWDRLRFSTKEGKIIGNNDQLIEKLFSVENLPVVSGLFGDNKHTVINRQEDNSLGVEPSEKLLINNAVELLTALQNKKIVVVDLHYIRHRGYVLKRKDDVCEILLGNPPYTAKIEQLQRVLRDLQKRQVQALRIELDYEGKAFIKEKTNL